MKELILIIVAACFSVSATAQCNTALNQLLPEKAVNNDDRFASHMAANGQYLVITAENSDTLGIMYGGVAYLYERTVAGWAYRAMLTASDPEEWSFFGTDVAIDDDGSTIVILDRLYPHNRIYIFEKPASGWETMTETFQLVSPDYVDIDASIDISADGNRIVLNHPWSKTPNFAVFYKPATGWLAAEAPQIITGPTHEFNTTLFAASVLMHGDYLYVSATNDPIGIGIYVYKLNAGSYEFLAKLSLSTPHNATHKFGYHITATDDMVATTGLVFDEEGYGISMTVFVFRKDGEWKDALETAQFEVEGSAVNISGQYPVEFLSSTVLASSMRVEDGDWYRGQLVVTTATDETWQDVDHEVIFESERVNSRFEFTRELVWNGSELLQSLATIPSGATTRDAALSITRSGALWGSLQRISILRNNSANFSFGYSVHKTGNTLFGGAPYDGAVGRGAGAVYVYEKSGDVYQRIHKILPPARMANASGTSDIGFGYSIASFGDEVAISAPSYRYGAEGLGKIFLYRRTGTSWASAELYDSISPPAELGMNRLGAAITMNARFLFASVYLSTQYNGVAIFEKIDGKWVYKDAVAVGRPLDKSWPSVRMGLHGNTLLVGASRTLEGGTFIFEEDADSGLWKSTSRISADVYSTFGNDVKLMENHFFVGVPTYPYNGIENSGAVFVYTRMPGRPWTSEMEPVAIIGAKTPIADAYFGFSVDAVGNTLVVGAPGGSRTSNGEVRTIPGNTYIFQTEDFYWKNTTEYLNLQGSRYALQERDNFGFDVGVDEENFYIGAMNENTSAGAFSGAVYYIPTPPLIYLIPPICKEEAFVQLEGYPFYGTWSGPGVEDPSGRFNPDLSGEGVFFLTYETAYCAYKGTVKVEVAAGPVVDRVSPEEVEICSEGGTQLQLTEVSGAEYNWYFKPSGRDDLFFIGSTGPQVHASNPGEYIAAVSNDFCTVNSPSFKVRIEAMPDVVIGPQPIVCNDYEVVLLIISVEQGTWQGTGVQDNKFLADALPNGKYPLVYRFVTPLGCEIAVRDTIEKKRVNEIALKRLAEDFCETGTATIQANGIDPSLDFAWFYRSEMMGQAERIGQQLGATAAFYEQGYYHLSATNGSCTGNSDTLQVGFSDDLQYTLLPDELNPAELCEGDVYDLQVNTRPQTTLEWLYAPNEDENFTAMTDEVSSMISAVKTGYYKVNGTYGFCSFESPPVYISFKSDTLWVPNVFTPNGDASNDVFSVQTNSDDLQLRIFNRYGKEIYITEGVTWDGGDAPSGTYYWHANYIGCRGEGDNARGWVQLMR